MLAPLHSRATCTLLLSVLGTSLVLLDFAPVICELDSEEILPAASPPASHNNNNNSTNSIKNFVVELVPEGVRYYRYEAVLQATQAVRFRCEEACFHGGTLVDRITLPLIILPVSRCQCLCPQWCVNQVEWAGYACELCRLSDNTRLSARARANLRRQGF